MQCGWRWDHPKFPKPIQKKEAAFSDSSFILSFWSMLMHTLDAKIYLLNLDHRYTVRTYHSFFGNYY